MTMTRFNFTDDVPLRYDDHGVIRVTGSRITLDVLVDCLEMGDTIDGIHEGFPSISLAQIDAIIRWYLDHKAEADEYIRIGKEEAEKIRREIESRPEYIAFRKRFWSRVEQMRKS